MKIRTVQKERDKSDDQKIKGNKRKVPQRNYNSKIDILVKTEYRNKVHKLIKKL